VLDHENNGFDGRTGKNFDQFIFAFFNSIGHERSIGDRSAM
jgi:hypothetical protein